MILSEQKRYLRVPPKLVFRETFLLKNRWLWLGIRFKKQSQLPPRAVFRTPISTHSASYWTFHSNCNLICSSKGLFYVLSWNRQNYLSIYWYIRCAILSAKSNIFHFSQSVSKHLCARHMNINHFEMKKNISKYTNLIDIYLHLLLLFCQLSVLTEVLFL